jgi:hypothetical protein
MGQSGGWGASQSILVRGLTGCCVFGGLLPAIDGKVRGEALREFFNRGRSSFDVDVHGFLLGYAKTRRIQATQNRRKKALAFV